MTHEEAIETISRCQTQIRDSIARHIEALRRYDLEIARALDVLDHLPQEPKPKLTRIQAFAAAAKIYDEALCDCSFDIHYDRKSRKTTCVIRVKPTGEGGRVTYAVGRAWCSRYDQSVAVVGYAIAYLRALGREVPEWLLHIPQE